MFLGKELINIMLEVTKVSTGEDPSAEVPRKSGGGRGRRETGWKWGGTWERALQLSAIFNVRYVLGTSLKKEAGNTTLKCCFSINMDALNVDFVRDLVVTQGKTFTSQFVATRSICWKERHKFAVRYKVLP